jgi:nucleotide-binding universal stress UspA family protein
MSSRIVIGYDGSDSGDDALVLGAFLNGDGDRAPLVVTVYPQENPIGVGRVDAEWVTEMRTHAQDISQGARRFYEGRGIEAEYRVVGSTSAAHGLDDVAESERASMIAVGSTRRGARRRILPGSTGERLLHGAGCPVAVAPRGMRERPTGQLPERIGVAYVDTPEARMALHAAHELASRSGASLRLFTVVAPRAEIFAPVAGRDAEEAFLVTLRQSAQDALDSAIESLPDGVEAHAELLEGDLVDELAALDERDVDLLVCGSRGYGPVRRVLLGGVSRRLVRSAASPLVIVPRSAV